MKIVKYETENEAEQIKNEHIAKGYILVEVSNVTEGNFLGFQETGWIEPEPETLLRDQLTRLETQNTELMLAVAELASVSETDKMETQIAIAELASIVMGGVA